MPVFFLSGALFPLEGLPATIKLITLFDPLTYGVDGLRGAFTGNFHLGLFTDLSVVIAITLIIGILGSYFFSKIEI